MGIWANFGEYNVANVELGRDNSTFSLEHNGMNRMKISGRFMMEDNFCIEHNDVKSSIASLNKCKVSDSDVNSQVGYT